MNVRALRGVCIGPGRHLVAGEEAQLDESLAVYLQSIGAVAPVPVDPAEPAPVSTQQTAPARKRTKEN